MKYRIACGMLDFFITVEAGSPDEAIQKAKEEAAERLNDATWWVVDPAPTGGTEHE